MSNELIFIISALADISFILFTARQKIEWLFGTIIVNIILIGIFGAKLIMIFGFTTNAGNVFYACVFLATYFILEKYGQRAGLRTIWLGIGFILFFTLLSQLASRLAGLALHPAVNESLLTIFNFSPRVTLASIIAYAFAQYVNIYIYQWLRLRTRQKQLWLRSNVANLTSQLVDSLLFFSIAFFDLPGPLLVQAILIGWLTKVLVVFVGTLFLYLDLYINRKKT